MANRKLVVGVLDAATGRMRPCKFVLGDVVVDPLGNALPSGMSSAVLGSAQWSYNGGLLTPVDPVFGINANANGFNISVHWSGCDASDGACPSNIHAAVWKLSAGWATFGVARSNEYVFNDMSGTSASNGAYSSGASTPSLPYTLGDVLEPSGTGGVDTARCSLLAIDATTFTLRFATLTGLPSDIAIAVQVDFWR